jgi:hypothetical protein
MPLYHLSNSQKKDLLINGVGVKLALPIPVNSDPEDRAAGVLDWAKAQIPEEFRQYATSAHCTLLPVALRTTGGRANLTEVIGNIVDDPEGGAYTIAVDCCVVTFSPRDARRGSRGIQWPVNVVHNGSLLIPKE